MKYLFSSYKVVLIHIIGWVSWLAFLLYMQPPSIDQELIRNFSTYFQYLNIFSNVFLIFNFYLNAAFLVPEFLYKKKTIKYIAMQSAILLIYILLAQALFHYLTRNTDFPDQGSYLTIPLPLLLLPYIFNLAISTTYRYVTDNIKKERWVVEKEKEGLKSELLFLKSQVSPHFVFNVLNNMVSLARKKSDALEPALIQLSSLLRYMLYDTNEDKVPLDKEIFYLENYIDLQKLRYRNYIRINTFMEAPKEALQIAPMLLIPFIENAFKHGTSLVNDGFIKVDLSFKESRVFFNVVNKYEKNGSYQKDKASGIGLVNVKRRLALLYSGRHQLDIHADEKGMLFMVNLEINLKG